MACEVSLETCKWHFSLCSWVHCSTDIVDEDCPCTRSHQIRDDLGDLWNHCLVKVRLGTVRQSTGLSYQLLDSDWRIPPVDNFGRRILCDRNRYQIRGELLRRHGNNSASLYLLKYKIHVQIHVFLSGSKATWSIKHRATCIVIHISHPIL